VEKMKIKEILELTKEKPISDIAKSLPVGEKKLRAILKGLGAQTPTNFVKGWTYENVDSTELEKDISEFVTRKATTKPKASKGNNKVEIRQYDQTAIKDDIIEPKASKITNEKAVNKDMTKDIIANMLNGISPQKPKKQFKGFYLDEDICKVLDRIGEGNKSQFVSMIIRAYLKENDLI
jgi:hypothetical protein